VLLKPGRLTAEEFEVMKQHTLIGGETLRSVAKARPEALYLTMAREIALTHHERFDGNGYPHGLKGMEIPLSGRIVAVADVYDALTSKRIYKPKYSHDTARSLILEGAGSQFDPDIVQAFLNCEQAFIDVSRQLRDLHGGEADEGDQDELSVGSANDLTELVAC
jgi:putative two-component system response regulator